MLTEFSWERKSKWMILIITITFYVLCVNQKMTFSLYAKLLNPCAKRFEPNAILLYFTIICCNYTILHRAIVECSPMVRETGVQSQIESYQRFLKWYLMRPGVTLSITRYVSRVKWSNPGKGVAPSPTLRCSSYWKGSLRVIFDYGRQLYLLTMHLNFVYR